MEPLNLPDGEAGSHARRISTESHDRFRVPADDDSWDAEVLFENDDEPMILPHRTGSAGNKPRSDCDRRKYIDNTTPTLEDEDRHHRHANQQQQQQQQLQQQQQQEEEDEEDDVEEEMISLAQERMRRNRDRETRNQNETAATAAAVVDADAATILRRHHHDGALRRTPGAIQMHQSHRTELLGFGLALTTPLAGGAKKDRRSPGHRPPRDPNNNTNLNVKTNTTTNHKREDVAYTPSSYALTKNPHIQVNHGAFSPNTLRLTEDLDNLLDEEDDESRHQFFRDSASGESWTKQYIFESEGGTAEITRMGKKNRRVSGRRSRNSTESPREYTPRQDHLHPLVLDQQYPQPVRSHETLRSNDDEVPQPLNFGGAFAPPSNRGNFQRPVPSSVPNDPPFQRIVPSHSPHDPPSFSAYNSQTFNPRAFAPHRPHLHDPRMGYPSSPMVNHHPVSSSMTGMLPLGYDERSAHMGSSFVPPNTYMQPHPANQHPGGWAPAMMPPNMNPYSNHHHHMASPPPPPQQQQRPWAQGMDTPWMDNSGFGYGLTPMLNRLTPSPHVYAQQQQQQQQQQPVFWQDVVPNVGYGSNSSPAVLHFEPPPPDLGPPLVDSVDAPFDEIDASRTNRRDSRTSKRNDKKQIKPTVTTNKVEKQQSRNKKVPSNATSATSSNASKVPTANSMASTKRGVKGRKDEEPPENPEEAKRAELVESPETRAAFKEFYRNFRLTEKSSIQEAEEYALQTLKSGVVPDTTHWRVFLELADLAKRSNKFEEARNLYAQVCKLQPYASQGWLEYSKLEEECGNMTRCSKILNEGLKYCEISENLLTRAIKHEEKINNLTRARELLARLKHVGIEKVWRTVLEGALLEGRAGNHAMARRVLKYLMHHVPWYGPLYLEAFRLERDLGRPEEALVIVETGLKTIPRYGPLWFGAFRLCETLDFNDKAYHLPRTLCMFERAIASISRELVWKVHLDAAQILERAALASVSDKSTTSLDKELVVCRKRIAMTALSCPSNLSWKVWLAGGRMELSAGNIDKARSLFLRAHKVVPEKGRVATLLECARLEEFAGDTELARAILCKSRLELSTDWKVWLESVLLEIRDGEHIRALDLAKQALEKHTGTGRLWASLVQLRYLEGGEQAQLSSLKSALSAVPKSGEVWCEGGRIHLNPYSRLFSLSEARRHLFFATRFTPQYGDGFLEILRLELIERWFLPMASCVWEAIQPHFVDRIDDTDVWISSLVISSVKLMTMATGGDTFPEYEEGLFDKSVVPSLRAQLETCNLDELFETSNLELRCANADPNYGSMWFSFRNSPTDTARVILRRGRDQLVAELKEHAQIYVAAIIRRCALMAAEKNKNIVMKEPASKALLDSKVTAKIEELAMKTPSIEAILLSKNSEVPNDTALLERPASGFHFANGLVALNRHKPLLQMPILERKKALFGSDALLS